VYRQSIAASETDAMPQPRNNRLLLCDAETRTPKKGSSGLDWPLSREEMKGRVLQLYDLDVRTADKVIQQSEQALGTSEAHVDQLSRSLRKIISEAKSALEELDEKTDSKGRQKQRAKSQDPRGKVPNEPSSKMVRQSRTPQKRVSFGEEPEKEPGESVPLLPPPMSAQCQMQSDGNHVDEETTGGAMKKLCEGMSGKLRDSVSDVVADVVDPPTLLQSRSDGPPADFVSFMTELLTPPSISWPKDVGAHFLKTE